MIENTSDDLDTPVGQAEEPRVYPRQTVWLYLNLSVFWFALAFLWGGLITIVIQHMVEEIDFAHRDLHLSRIIAVGALISTVIVIIVGAMSDRSRWALGKRRPYMIVGALFSVPSLWWLSQVNTLLGIFLAFCAIQFWVNMATSPYQALIPDMVPKEKQGTAAAYMGLGSLLGQLGGIVVCFLFIYKPHGILIITSILSGLLVAAMLWTVWRVPERPATHNPAPVLGLWATVRDAFDVEPRRYPDFFWLIGSRFMINMGFYSATTFLLYYVRHTLGMPKPRDMEVMFIILVITTVSGLLGNFPAGILSDRVSKKLVVYVTAVITSVAALLFVFTQSLPYAYTAAFFFGAGFGAFAAVDWALATNLLPDQDEAKYMGVWHVAFTVPQVVAPFLGGPIAYLFNERVTNLFGYDLGPGFGYRVVLFMVIVYFGIGVLLIRPVRERVIHRKPAS